MVVTEQSHPHIYKAFKIIALDNGAVNRLEPLKTQFDLTGMTIAIGTIGIIERALATLSEKDLETFCCGESEEITQIAGRSLDLKMASNFLNRYFEELM